MAERGAIPIVIAAGGDGARIGGGKPDRALAGRSLLDHAVAYAAQHSDQMAIALRPTSLIDLPDGMIALYDAADHGGPLSALESALTFAKARDMPTVMMIGCDMPFLPDDLLPRLHHALEGHGVALACSGGRLHPLAGVWRTEVLDILPDYWNSGRRSMQGFARECTMAKVDWPITSYDPFFNINTHDDLQKAERLASRGEGHFGDNSFRRFRRAGDAL
ncbi:molybdenum cofactor guanylyltransferase [Iodidimonas nitroreducens]|uniref:Molybdenum cofactor guanylyltransferase n=1 Tax=Iodidimonas nitroreducens TaxID=1236968 RepID=A0A5A7N7T1_9PROT|nr:molybdenum cofactor guanylyltransferase [Iodidimonas nitroreducens]GAK33609.1 molybdenum cofactor guanylyltransferase [alpha proteobacterium Q-1]GER03695.1 molybdenum cofactor guanylyltransferase [Iodidimonas nitroreducens]